MSDDYLKAAFTGEFDTVAPLHQVSKSVSHVWWHGGMIKDVERDDPIIIDDLDVCFQAANDLIRFQQEPAVAPLLADLVMSLGLSMTRGPSSLAMEPGTKEYEKTPTWVLTDRKPTNYDKVMAFFNRDESEFPFFAAWKAYNTAATPEAALQIAKDRELVHNPAEAKAFVDTCNAVDKTGALKYAYVGFVMLNVCRLITKDVNNMGNMAVRVAKSFSSIYRTSAPTPNNWFAAPALLAIKNGLNPGRPVVKGFITMVASQWETGLTSSDPVMTEFKSVLEAGVVIALVMNSMPLIAITDRVLEVLKISFIALLKSIYFEDIKQSVAMIQGVQTLYMFDPATRALLLAKNPGLAPITDARLWRFSRLLNPNVMSGLSGNNHDTFLYLMIEIHDNFSPNPMKASYRKFMPTVSEAHLNKLASAAKEGIGAIHVGAPEFTGTAVKALPADMRVPVAKKKEKEKPAAAPVVGSAPKTVGTPAPKPTTTTGATTTTTPVVEEVPASVDPALNKKPRTEDTEESDSGEEVEDL